MNTSLDKKNKRMRVSTVKIRIWAVIVAYKTAVKFGPRNTKTLETDGMEC